MRSSCLARFFTPHILPCREVEVVEILALVTGSVGISLLGRFMSLPVAEQQPFGFGFMALLAWLTGITAFLPTVSIQPCTRVSARAPACGGGGSCAACFPLPFFLLFAVTQCRFRVPGTQGNCTGIKIANRGERCVLWDSLVSLLPGLG